MIYDCISQEHLDYWFEWFFGHVESYTSIIGCLFLILCVVFLFLNFLSDVLSDLISLFKPQKDDFIEYCFKKDGVPFACDVEDYFIEYCRFYDEVKRVRKFYSKRKNYKKYIINGDIE